MLQLCVSVSKSTMIAMTYSRKTECNCTSGLVFFHRELKRWDIDTSSTGTKVGIGKELKNEG